MRLRSTLAGVPWLPVALVASAVAIAVLQFTLEFGALEASIGGGQRKYFALVLAWFALSSAIMVKRRHRWLILLTAPIALYPLVLGLAFELRCPPECL